MDVIIDQIVELDRENMSAILAESGDPYLPDRRRTALVEEIARGSRVITQYNDSELVGYLQFSTKDEDEIYVASLQVKRSYRDGVVLRKLLRDFTSEISSQRPVTLTSSVHINNDMSLRLHERLGFEVARRVEQRYKFTLPDHALERWVPRLHSVC